MKLYSQGSLSILCSLLISALAGSGMCAFAADGKDDSKDLPVVAYHFENPKNKVAFDMIAGEFDTDGQQARAEAGVEAQIQKWSKEKETLFYGNYDEWDPGVGDEGRNPAQNPGVSRGEGFVSRVLTKLNIRSYVDKNQVSAGDYQATKTWFPWFRKQRNVYTAIRIGVPVGANIVILSLGRVPLLRALVQGFAIAVSCGAIAKYAVKIIETQTLFRLYNKILSNPNPKNIVSRTIQNLMINTKLMGAKDLDGKVLYDWPRDAAGNIVPSYKVDQAKLPLRFLGRALNLPHQLLNFSFFELIFGIGMFTLSKYGLHIGDFTGSVETWKGFFIAVGISTAAQGVYEAWVGNLAESEKASGMLLEQSELNTIRRSMIGSILSVGGFSLSYAFPEIGYPLLGTLGALGVYKLWTLPRRQGDRLSAEIKADVCNVGYGDKPRVSSNWGEGWTIEEPLAN